MKLELNGGFYQSKSLISSAQRCVNLFPERNPPDSPFPFTTYPTPGLTEQVQGAQGAWRGLYSCSNGDLYGVLYGTLYFIDTSWELHVVGVLQRTPDFLLDPANPMVSMADNGLILVIVDGTEFGYYVDLKSVDAEGNPTRVFGQIRTPAFYGSDFVYYIDTFFIFNQVFTRNFYISASELSVALITGGSVANGTIAAGFGYSNGTHLAVPLTGGSGAGATADIDVALGQVTGVRPNAGQISSPYQVGDVLSADPASLGGGVISGNIVAGIGYTNGTYTNILLTGGTGTRAVGTVVVAGGVVTTVTITTQGQDYVVGDSLTSTGLGAGTGFAYILTAVNTTGSGFAYTVTQVIAGVLGFDPLDIAAKSGGQDFLVAAVVIHDEIWLIGRQTTEVWINSGAADFTFQKLPGIFIQHGCVAKASIAQADLSLFWLGRDPQGNSMVFQGVEYTAKRISTHAIEQEIQSYGISPAEEQQGFTANHDALGFTYQQEGHVFYILTFPYANKTWVYDMATELWHERVFTDLSGNENRWRPNCYSNGFGNNVVGDFQNGKLYTIDPSVQWDESQPIVRRRSFPQLINEGKRVSYDRFVAEMQVGTIAATNADVAPFELATTTAGTDWLSMFDTTQDALLAIPGKTFPKVSLRYSFNRGASYGQPVPMPIGSTGQYDISMQRRQLGIGRYFVAELFWSGEYPTALSGAYIDVSPAET